MVQVFGLLAPGALKRRIVVLSVKLGECTARL
jgi:hypothetical protein